MPDAGVPASPPTTPGSSTPGSASPAHRTPGPATAFAVALLEEFVRAGVRDIVVAPGSRSQALALAAAEFERAGLLRLHVRIDERGAGFLALGLAVESRHPSIVVTTSGTAVANLHPAVLEAHHSGVPLVVLTADRPAELRGIRSNQTTMQPGIFAGAVRLERDVAAPDGAAGESDAAARLARDAVAATLGFDGAGAFVAHPGPGPVHVNLQLREPLSSPFDVSGLRSGAEGDASRNPMSEQLGFERRPAAPGAPQPAPGRALIEPGPRTVVIAGAGAGPEAEEFARVGGWPLFAEVTSGAHFGPNLVVAYRDLLREPGFGDQVQRAVVFGHPTLSREVPALVQRDDVETIASRRRASSGSTPAGECAGSSGRCTCWDIRRLQTNAPGSAAGCTRVARSWRRGFPRPHRSPAASTRPGTSPTSRRSAST